MQIKIDPNAIPEDMTQEELDEMMKTLEEKLNDAENFEDSTLFKESEPVDMQDLETSDPELFELLTRRLKDAKEHKAH